MKFLVKVFYPQNWKGDTTIGAWISSVNVLFINKGVVDVKLSSANGIPADAILEIGSDGLERYNEVKAAILETICRGMDPGAEKPMVMMLPVSVLDRLSKTSDSDEDEEEAKPADADKSEDEPAEEEEDDDPTLDEILQQLRARKAELEAAANGDSDEAEQEKEKEKKNEEKENPNKTKPSKKKEEDKPEEKDPFKEINDRLDELVNIDEFRALCREIMAIAPKMVKRNARSIFANQCYLFSIGDGQGLSTCLELLGDTIVAAKLSDAKRTRVIECKLPYDTGDKNSTWEQKAYEAMSKASGSPYNVVLCFDISEWIGHLTNAKFIEFLRDAFEDLEDFSLVFRVPYLDKEVFSRVKESLSDVFYTRPIVFPPLTMDNFRDLTEIELMKYGYKLTDSAWTFMEKKLSEEKSDGRFYGINTLEKVIGELLYKKELTNLHAKKESLTITKSDAKALCSFQEEVNADEMLNALVGMDEIKQRLKEVVAQIEASRKIPGVAKPCIHMRFLGNPGTGKTSIARILGKLLKEKGILRIGNFFEYSGRDFCGRYVGETAPKTSGICRDAYGSVLFVDEAYSLYRGDRDSKDYGREALDTLIAEMENHRDDMLVIMAGYSDEMNTMASGNIGLQSRMPYTIEFKNYDREQLFNIFMSMMKKSFEYEPDVEAAAKEYFDGLSKEFLESKEFSNGRFVRNLFERTWAKASMRCELNKGKIVINKEDFLRSTTDVEFKKTVQGGKRRIGFGFN